MDYIILNNDGSIANIAGLVNPKLKRYIQQGNNGVDKIFIGWPLGLSTDYGQAVFTLPNQLTNTVLGEFKANYPYEADDPDNPPSDYDGETCNGWVITLTSDQTIYNGGLFVSFRVIRNGIVQVAFPFTLMINETGVRPDTDSGVTIAQLDSYLLNIQNLVTGAVRQNTDAALSPTSENPVQNKVITAAIEAIKRGSYTKVDTTEYPTLEDFLDSEGEEGFLYLYPVDTSDESEGYYQYIWENEQWIPLGTTKIDIANMVTTDTAQEITGSKTIKDTPLNFVYTGATGDAKWHIEEDNYGRLAISRTYNNIKTTYWVIDGSGFIPFTTNTNVLGTTNRYYKDAYINNVHSKSLSFKRYDAPENTLVLTDEMMTELMSGGIAINGKLYGLNIYNPVLFKGTYTSTNDVWGICVYSAQANGELQEIAMYRIPQSTKQFSITTYDWINLKNVKNINSIPANDIGKKLYKHVISHVSGIGAPLLVIISTDGEEAEDVAGVNRLLSGDGFVNAFCRPLASSNIPQEIWQIYSYLFTEGGSNSLNLRYVAEDSNHNLKTIQFLLNDAYTTTDTVSPMN